MTTTLLRLVLLCFLAPRALWADDAAEAVCNRLLPKATLASLAPGFALDSFSDTTPGEWLCAWKSEGHTTRRITVRYVSTADADAKARYQDAVAKVAKYNPQDVSGIAPAATVVTLGTSYLLYVRTPIAFLSVSAYEGTREQLLSIAKYMAAVPTPLVTRAREALATVRSRPVAPPPPLEDVEVRQNGLPLECERLLPRAKVVAVFGDAYHLTFAAAPRPDASSCEWTREVNGYAIGFILHGPAEFADAKVAGPKEYFAVELGFASCGNDGGSPVPGLGLEARICGSGPLGGTIVVRRAKDVLVFGCVDCDRNKLVTLARAALR